MGLTSCVYPVIEIYEVWPAETESLQSSCCWGRPCAPMHAKWQTDYVWRLSWSLGPTGLKLLWPWRGTGGNIKALRAQGRAAFSHWQVGIAQLLGLSTGTILRCVLHYLPEFLSGMELQMPRVWSGIYSGIRIILYSQYGTEMAALRIMMPCYRNKCSSQNRIHYVYQQSH